MTDIVVQLKAKQRTTNILTVAIIQPNLMKLLLILKKNNENSASPSKRLSNEHNSNNVIDDDRVTKKESFVLEAAEQLSRQSPNGYISHEELYHRLVDSGEFDPLSAANFIFRLVEAGKLIKLKDYFAAYILSNSSEEKMTKLG